MILHMYTCSADLSVFRSAVLPVAPPWELTDIFSLTHTTRTRTAHGACLPHQSFQEMLRENAELTAKLENAHKTIAQQA